MHRLLPLLCAALLVPAGFGCKDRSSKADPAKMRQCKNMPEAGKQDPERDCKRCCKDANSFSYSYSVNVGCTCS